MIKSVSDNTWFAASGLTSECVTGLPYNKTTKHIEENIFFYAFNFILIGIKRGVSVVPFPPIKCTNLQINSGRAFISARYGSQITFNVPGRGRKIQLVYYRLWNKVKN